jgi:ArsR family transcriptional regulator, arsenate/arsenite/antimonite-responsive transcriptional repressor
VPTALPVLTPRERQPGGCCVAAVVPDLGADEAVELAALVKALADPTRLQILDVVRKAAPEAICQCELVPLFDMSQPALSKHLKVLIAAGVLESEKRGLWTYYYERPEAREELIEWLS